MGLTLNNLMSAEAKTAPPRESLPVNLICNVVIPSILLIKGQAWLGIPSWATLCVALAFPVAYFIHDFRRRGRRNIISIIGFVSTLITGGVGLLHLDTELIAIKEAAVPGLFGIAILLSSGTRHPLISAFLLNPDFFDVERIERAVKERDANKGFDRVMRQGTLLLALSFGLSAALNYMLARMIVHSPSGTEAFNAELGKLQLLSYPVIALPATMIGMLALWHVLKGIKRHAGLEVEEIFLDTSKSPDTEEPPAARAADESGNA